MISFLNVYSKLLLQPFVENAINHGFRRMTKPCCIEITMKLFGAQLYIRIRDNGCGLPQELVNELNKKGYVEKTPDTADKRVILVSLTPLGRDVYEVYGLRYHEWLSQLLEPIADEDIEAAIRAIRYANKLMSAVSPDISKLHNAGTPQSDK